MGTVGTLEDHEAKCSLVLLPCPNKCKGDQNHFMRKDLDQHVANECPNRDYTCEHCGQKGMYVMITGYHDLRCPEKIVPCPKKGCDVKVKRQEVRKHDKECLYTTVPYKYENIGCKIVPIRKDVAVHEEDDKFHLHMAIDMVSKLSDMNAKLSDLNTKLSNRIAAIENVKPTPFTFKLNQFTWYIENNIMWKLFKSPSFYTSLKGYRMHINVHPTHDDVHVSIFLDPGDYDDDLSWPFRADIAKST